MFHTNDPRRTILVYTLDTCQLATLKISLEDRICLSQCDTASDFIERVLAGEKGICLNTDLSVTYIGVGTRAYGLKSGVKENRILVIQKGVESFHYTF